jgi:integrase/recombinase XerD
MGVLCGSQKKEVPVTHLRNMMLEELQRRNYSQSTTRAYVRVIRELAKHFHQPPDRLGPDHIRQFQAYLFRERKLEPNTVVQYSAGLRFFFVKTLKRHFMVDNIPLPKQPWKLPIILSQQEVSRLIDAASNLMHRAILMTLYSTGMRRAELCHLQVTDIDKERMVIHIHQGKGQRDRDVDLSEKLLETLREYWRWMRPKTYLFPGTVNNWRADVPITGKVVWAACRQATKRAGIQKRVYPHLLRHCYATHWLESGGDLVALQKLLGHAKLEDTVKYLHLSRRHLRCVANPLDNLTVTQTAQETKRSRLKKKR